MKYYPCKDVVKPANSMLQNWWGKRSIMGGKKCVCLSWPSAKASSNSLLNKVMSRMTESFISRSWGMKTFCETSIFYDYFGLQSRLVIAQSLKQTRKSHVKRKQCAAKKRDREVCHRVHTISSFRNLSFLLGLSRPFLQRLNCHLCSHSSVISIGNRMISSAIWNK